GACALDGGRVAAGVRGRVHHGRGAAAERQRAGGLAEVDGAAGHVQAGDGQAAGGGRHQAAVDRQVGDGLREALQVELAVALDGHVGAVGHLVGGQPLGHGRAGGAAAVADHQVVGDVVDAGRLVELQGAVVDRGQAGVGVGGAAGELHGAVADL